MGMTIQYPVVRLYYSMIDHLQGARYFTKLYLHTGYHQIRINEEYVLKTTFCVCYGHYEFLFMPFGLTNGLTTFQQEPNEISENNLENLSLFS